MFPGLGAAVGEALMAARSTRGKLRLTSRQNRLLKLLGQDPWYEDRCWKKAKPAFLVGYTQNGLRLVTGGGETLDLALSDALSDTENE